MKTIGLLGGMSWESTRSYYELLNQGVRQQLGGLNSAKICLYSVNFSDIEQLQHQGRWDETAVILAQAAQAVEAGGADFLLICTNTMHKVADQIAAQVNIPLLHIADATAMALTADHITKVALLGTRFTMSQDFYKQRLIEQFGIEVLVPNDAQQTIVHDIIYQELCQGMIRPESRAQYLAIMADLVEQGAQAVILGCTEIALLIQPEHTDIPLYDTTALHAAQAVKLALAD